MKSLSNFNFLNARNGRASISDLVHHQLHNITIIFARTSNTNKQGTRTRTVTMPVFYTVPIECFPLTSVKHNFLDAFVEPNGNENLGWDYFLVGEGTLWLAHRFVRGIESDSELVFYIVDSEKVYDKMVTPPPDLVIPVSFIQEIRKEKHCSTGYSTGDRIRRGVLKLLAEVDTKKGPEWFTLQMEMSDYKRCKDTLAKLAPNLRFSK